MQHFKGQYFNRRGKKCSKEAKKQETGNEAWIYGDLIESIRKTLKRIWNKGLFPEQRREKFISPLYKKGREEESGKRQVYNIDGHGI